MCGEYATVVAHYLLKGLTYKDILKYFSDNRAVSDHKVKSYVNSQFPSRGFHPLPSDLVMVSLQTAFLLASHTHDWYGSRGKHYAFT